MSFLKYAINVMVQQLHECGITYINENMLLQSIKNDQGVTDMMFRALMDLLLQTCYNLDQAYIAQIWDQFNYTMADFVYFAESSLVELGYPFFISSYPIKQIKSMAFLSSKAIMSSIIYILITYYDFEGRVQATLDKQPQTNKHNKYEVTHPTLVNKVQKGAKKEIPSVQVLQLLYTQQKEIIKQISEQLPMYKSQDRDSPSKALMTFMHKLFNKMLTEVRNEQLQRSTVEKYDVSQVKIQSMKQEPNETDLLQANYTPLSKTQMANMQALQSRINNLIAWVKQEFWME